MSVTELFNVKQNRGEADGHKGKLMLNKLLTICAMILFICASVNSQSAKKQDACDAMPIAFMQHGTVAPNERQQFWSVIQNCSSRIIKYRYTVTLLRDGKPLRVLQVKNITVGVGESNTDTLDFEADSILGNYACLATVTATGVSAVNSASFIVR